MWKLRNVKLVAALTAAVIGLSLSGGANAGVQEKMNKIFGDRVIPRRQDSSTHSVEGF